MWHRIYCGDFNTIKKSLHSFCITNANGGCGICYQGYPPITRHHWWSSRWLHTHEHTITHGPRLQPFRLSPRQRLARGEAGGIWRAFWFIIPWEGNGMNGRGAPSKMALILKTVRKWWKLGKMGVGGSEPLTDSITPLRSLSIPVFGLWKFRMLPFFPCPLRVQYRMHMILRARYISP